MSPTTTRRLRALRDKIRALEEKSLQARRGAQDVSGDEMAAMTAQASAYTVQLDLEASYREFVRVWSAGDADDAVREFAEARHARG